MLPKFPALNRWENILPFQMVVKEWALSVRMCYITQRRNTTTEYTCKWTDINRQAKGLTIRELVFKNWQTAMAYLAAGNQ